ncbi:MAG TPA: MerR family transcriptional regulator [Aggregatilinea sp.]|jgi:DNA-binding transcriptional MerR regulator|uniref:MerR family transcriptional regulator n=1 Tax=Aggregatilinea sp. TaxID=2806333 RepID=UPI002B9A09F0|nr:MerR family transcriptional regulator [Aggregatilinea sp.]HML24840.1 MerR family transcriptional regulator [Aggregatilinea sp.]
MEETLSIQEMADRTGLTAHTLRYYERIGLIQPVDRASSGHRRYSEEDVSWVEFLKRLRSTGMPIREMQSYAGLLWQGDQTVERRRKLLERHRARVMQKIQELTEYLTVLDWKINHYKEVECMESNLETPAKEAVQ